MQLLYHHRGIVGSGPVPVDQAAQAYPALPGEHVVVGVFVDIDNIDIHDPVRRSISNEIVLNKLVDTSCFYPIGKKAINKTFVEAASFLLPHGRILVEKDKLASTLTELHGVTLTEFVISPPLDL